MQVDGFNIKSILVLLGMPILIVVGLAVLYFAFAKFIAPLLIKLEEMEAKANKGKDIHPIWPEINDVETAMIVAKKNGRIYYFIGGLIGVFSIAQFMGHTYLSLIDSLIFIAIGIGVHKMSRIAAIVGILLYVAPRVYAIVNGQIIFNLVIVLIFMACLINTARATFKYHQLKKLA